MIHFFSDPHWNHSNIIKYSNRPFSDVQTMNQAMIDNWNLHVQDTDTVYLLGDLCWMKTTHDFENVFQQLNGSKHLIFGNHDKALRKNKALLEKYFLSTQDYLEVDIGKQMIVMCHYPILEWNKCHRGAWHLHGHVHGNRQHPKPCKMLDVGVDPLAKMRGGQPTDFYPISFTELEQYMAKQPLLEHH